MSSAGAVGTFVLVLPVCVWGVFPCVASLLALDHTPAYNKQCAAGLQRLAPSGTPHQHCGSNHPHPSTAALLMPAGH